jgi:hypothetical protein
MRLIFFLIFSLLVACQGEINKLEAPNGLIPISEMKLLVNEILILESAINKRHQQVSKHYRITKASVDNYLRDKGVSINNFQESLDFYHANQELGMMMYDEVLEDLILKKDEVDSSKT